jgi:hypothetical protein
VNLALAHLVDEHHEQQQPRGLGVLARVRKHVEKDELIDALLAVTPLVVESNHRAPVVRHQLNLLVAVPVLLDHLLEAPVQLDERRANHLFLGVSRVGIGQHHAPVVLGERLHLRGEQAARVGPAVQKKDQRAVGAECLHLKLVHGCEASV